MLLIKIIKSESQWGGLPTVRGGKWDELLKLLEELTKWSGGASNREGLRKEGAKWQSAHLVSSIMHQAFKWQFVTDQVLLTEIKPDTQDAASGGWKGQQQHEQEV